MSNLNNKSKSLGSLFLRTSLLIIILSASFEFEASGALTDNEGYPVVYLRGEFGRTNWGIDEDYIFTRNGNTYSLEIGAANPVPKGRFKIADEDWNFDFGAASENVWINESCDLTLTAKGANINTDGIFDGKISFIYKEGLSTLEVKFEIDAAAPDAAHQISGTLPVMYINVFTDDSHNSFNNEVIDYNLSHKDYFNYAEYWLDLNGCEQLADLGAASIGSEEEPLPLQIKARGNWTRIGFSKKPFKLKLDKKQNLLGLTPEKSKHYALLAHADDNKGFLRNFTTFNLGRRIGLPWTPGMQPVELVINGDYRGLYFLTESVRVGDGRIEIAELADNETDPEMVSGGYVVELDNYYEDNQIRMEEKSWARNQHLDELRVTWDTPEEYSDLQKRFVTDQFSAINDAVGSNSNDTWAYLDLDDAARYYLVCEIVSHTESFHGSTYLYRDRGENQKWHFSPLWDAGNAFSGHTDQFFYNCDPFGNTWIPSMRENKTFNDKVKETWLWFMQNEYSGVEEDMAEFAQNIKAAAVADHNRWKNESHPDGGIDVADNTDMDARLKDVKAHLSNKIAWLKGKFGDYSTGKHDEPERDSTPAALLPDYIMAGVETIIDDISGKKEYYNLQGMKVSRLEPGQIYIIKEGAKTRKVLWFGSSMVFD